MIPFNFLRCLTSNIIFAQGIDFLVEYVIINTVRRETEADRRHRKRHELQKKFQKTLDNSHEKCYNKTVPREVQTKRLGRKTRKTRKELAL